MKKISIIIVAVVLLVVTIGASLDFFMYHLRLETDNSSPVASAPAEQSIESDVWVRPKDVRFAEDVGQILYMEGDSLMLYDVADHEKKTLTVNDTIIDYDISRDGRMIAYAARPDKDFLFSVISVFDRESGKTTELQPESEAISESGPVFFPDASKIAYIRRTSDKYSGALSDGEIWVRDLKGITSDHYHLIGDDSKLMIDISKLDKNIRGGRWDGTFFCIDNDDIIGPKMKVQSISADGKHIVYGQSEWVPECSGIDFRFRPANIDGSAFLTDRYARDYGTVRIERGGKYNDFKWYSVVSAWLKDGSFIASKGIGPPMSGRMLAAYDRNQREKHVFYDTTKNDEQNTHAYDVKPLSDGSFLVLYASTVSKKMFLKQMRLDDASSLDLSLEGEFSFENAYGSAWNWKIVDGDTISYTRNVGGHVTLFVRDLASGEEGTLGQLN